MRNPNRNSRSGVSAERRHCRIRKSGALPSRRYDRSGTGGRTLVPLLLSAFCLCAQAQYSIDWSTVDGGGGTSTGVVYSVSGTIGQPDAGRMTGGNFTLEGGFWGMVSAIQTPGASLLSIELINGLVRVSWPAPAPGWVLTETNQVNGMSSLPCPVVPAAHYQTNEGRISILTLPQSLPNRFYRLHKP